MIHSGLIAPPDVLFHDDAQDECLSFCQEFIDEIVSDPTVPVQTGLMKGSFVKSKHDGGGKVTNDTPYLLDVEYGHDIVDQAGKVVGHKHARPFMRKAFESVKASHR